MLIPPSRRASSFSESVARITAQCACDDDSIHPVSGTRVWSHGAKTPRAILYLHGYTDSVQQFAPLAERLFAQGHNVFAPRVPHHGYKDRMTAAHSKLTSGELIEWASAATDTALGLGDSLTVMGLSLGGVLATWVAQCRADVDRVLLLAPAYGTSVIPPRLTPAATRLLNGLPNMFVWWDPRVREGAGFEYTYPRFATRTLAQIFRLGGELLQAARKQPPAARVVWMITNANDFAVSNTICDAFVAAWRAHQTKQVSTFQFPRELGIPHDLMDPADPGVKPEIVYPRLLEIINQER